MFGIRRLIALSAVAVTATACAVSDPAPAEEEVSLGMACEIAQCQCRAVRQPVFGKTVIEPPEWHMDGNAYCTEGFVLEKISKSLF